MWLHNIVGVRAEHSEAAKPVSAMMDLTNAKDAEARLEYVSGLQRILVDAAETLVAAGDDDDEAAIDGILQRIGEHCGVERTYIVDFDGRRRAMSMSHEWHASVSRPLRGHLVDRPRSAVPKLVDEVEQHRVVHLPRIADLDDSWAVDHIAFREQGLRSVLIVPIIVDGSACGYIGFDSIAHETEWDEPEIQLLRGLADIIGAVRQRARAERERRASEARYRAIAEHIPGAVYERVLEPDGRVRLTYVSPNSKVIFAIDPAAAMADPRNMLEHVHPEDRGAYEAALARSAQELSPLDISHRIMGRDDRIYHARLLGQPHAAADGSITWHGITIDETERVEAEARLAESRALQEIAGRSARIGGWRIDLDEQRAAWSDEVCELVGVSPGTAFTRDAMVAFFAPEWQPRIRQLLAECARTGLPFDEEMELITAASRRLWIRVMGEAVHDSSGSIMQIRGALQDITEQKAARDEARHLAERLSNTLESITDAFMVFDCEWRFTYLNREAERLFGRRREDLLGRVFWDEYPDTRHSTLEREYREAMAQQRTAEFEFFYPPYNMWLEIRAYPSQAGLTIYFRDISERKRAREEIEFLALYDPLTQLPNRRLLLDRLGQALQKIEGTGLCSAILFLDLDHFKTLNDTLGHDVGDRLLCRAALRLRQCVRRTDTVARFGGDEFAIILERLKHEPDEAIAQACQVAEKVRAVLAQPYEFGYHERHASASIGITLFANDGADSSDDIMKRADLAMYQAKAAGRGTVRVFDPAMRAAVQSRVKLEADLRKALARGEVVPWFQPQIDHNDRIVGAETLARWLPAGGEPVSPADFISVAEESDLILELGDTVLEAACRLLADWATDPALGPLDFSVNVSPRQFHHPGFVDQVRRIAERTAVRLDRLWLELTESLLLADIEDTARKMTALRADGIRFTLDDFGTGYSSLAYLKRLPLDQLKIDKSFVADALSNSNDAAIVRTIIVLARTMGMDVVAEGVETESVRAALAADGCTIYQGFLFSPALPAAEFEAFVRQRTR